MNEFPALVFCNASQLPFSLLCHMVYLLHLQCYTCTSIPTSLQTIMPHDTLVTFAILHK